MPVYWLIILTLFSIGFAVQLIKHPSNVIMISIVIAVIFILRSLYEKSQQNPAWIVRFRDLMLPGKQTSTHQFTTKKKRRKHSFRVIEGKKKNSL